MDTESILAALERNEGSFPRAALAAAMEQREEITPHLLEALQYTRTHLNDLPDNYWLHFWAMYLLAQFRETRAYPLIIALLDLPSEQADWLHGDFITEDAPRVLASVCGGDTTPIKQLAEDPAADEFVRGAALGALVVLVAAGQTSRAEVIEYFRRLYGTGQAPPGSMFWTALVDRSVDLFATSLRAEIAMAYAMGLPDSFFMQLADVNAAFSGSEAAALERLANDSHMRLVEDTIEETRYWNFGQPTETSATAGRSAPAAPAPSAPMAAWFRPEPATAAPKPGRNDRCPCGSGLKYKKCCMKGGAGAQ